MKKSLTLGVLLGFVSTSHAQPYSLTWFAVAAGGGSLAGGSYVVQGTIGQPEPGGPRVATPYLILGGFWPGTASTILSASPKLSVELQSDGTVLLSWPLSASGFELDTVSDLGATSAPAQWSVVPWPYLTNADRISVTVQPVGSRFYRLKSL